ncbi:Non-heme 11 kDa protein of cytochrome bc1 complex [Amanita rubescens]|nr:Non-heme 11 kDa protein of cytochrome bc1 complex [Amanita rubescens]KAF8347161.1 Non-heme 11 kDa protein of cytochrome bc1 complex [Amanita rubescens]
MSPSITSFFSSFLPTVYADTQEPSEGTVSKVEEEQESAVEESKAEEAASEEEEEEPEDPHPAIREECKESAKCAALTKHFEHCQEKVQAGKGFHGEDCVEEFMMHCVDECAAPKLFSKLK